MGSHHKKPRRSHAQNRDWRTKFLTSLSKVPVVIAACRAACIESVTAYRNRQADPEFARKWDEALDAGIGLLEVKVHDQAVNGLARGVWRNDNNGNPIKVETVREYPHSLQMFLLRCRKPEVYREPQAQVNTQVNVAVTSEPRPLKEAPTDKLLALLNEIEEVAANGNGHSVVLTKPLE